MTFKSLVSILISLAVATCSMAQVERLAADEDLNGASISAMIADALTGEELESHQKDLLACPASVWKLATTSAALHELGRNFRFVTKLVYSGEITEGVLNGDLIIMGSGDPSLGSRHFDNDFDSVLDSYAEMVRAAGIDSIAGKVIGNGAHLQGQSIPGTRVWEDMGNYFGAGIHGLNFSDNTYFLSFQTPAEPDEPAKLISVYPEVPQIELRSEVKSSTVQSDQAYIFGSPLESVRVVRGTLPLGRDRFSIKGSIPDPALFAAYHFSQSLEKGGIRTNGYSAEKDVYREPVTYRILGTTESVPLSRMVQHINRVSDNLMAEGLLVQLGAKSGNPSIEGGLEVLRGYLKSAWGEETRFFAYDGSGLSRFNAVSAGQLVELLTQMRNTEDQNKYILDVLPVAGKEGSVKWFGLRTNLSGNTKLKSGSMKNVKAYAGMLQTYSGRELAFAVLVNNFEVSGTEVRKKIEDWLIRAYGRY